MRRRVLVALLIAGAAALAASWPPSAPVVSSSPAAPTASDRLETSSSVAWQARAPMDRPRGNLFASPAPARSSAAAGPQAPEPAGPPPMPYRVAGSVTREGVPILLLARGNTVLSVAEGDTLDGGYLVESISAAEVTLLYVPLGLRERLPIY